MTDTIPPCPKCGGDRFRRPSGYANGRRKYKFQCRTCALVYSRSRDPAKRMESVMKWQRENRGKYNAQAKVRREILAGRVTRLPCERCGTTERVHAHHEDYSKPLEVMWLCSFHHGERHRELNRIAA